MSYVFELASNIISFFEQDTRGATNIIFGKKKQGKDDTHGRMRKRLRKQRSSWERERNRKSTLK